MYHFSDLTFPHWLGLRTFSWRLSGRIVAVSGREERERAVELYFTTSMSTKQVVEHLGYPTRQCLERWLHADPRYADAVPKPPIPLGTRRACVQCFLAVGVVTGCWTPWVGGAVIVARYSATEVFSQLFNHRTEPAHATPPAGSWDRRGS